MMDVRVPADPRRSVWDRMRFLVTPRWIALMIGAVAFALACYFLLAPWQFSRSEQQNAQNAAIAAGVQAAPAPIGTLMSTSEQPGADAIWRAVTVTGTFDPSREVYVRLRQDNDGDPANEVVVPLVTADGAAVLVDRGYVSLVSVQKGAALPALPVGVVTVTGRVQADQTDPLNRPASPAPDGRMQYTAVTSALAGSGPVYRGYLQLTPESPGVIDAIGLPQQESGPYFSYALQWLAFGAIAVLGIGYFIYREFSDPVEENSYLPDENGTDPGDGDEAAGVSPGPADSDLPDHVDRVAATTARRHPGRTRTPKFDKSQLYDR